MIPPAGAKVTDAPEMVLVSMAVFIAVYNAVIIGVVDRVLSYRCQRLPLFLLWSTFTVLTVIPSPTEAVITSRSRILFVVP